MTYDLHCHSHFSDGNLSPKELVALAKEKNVTNICITDHDSFQSFFDVPDLPFPGIELSCDFEQKSIHVLAYAFNPYDPQFQQFCLQQRIWRVERLIEMCAKLTKLGTPLEPSDVMATDDPNYTIGRVHIALALMKKGYVKTVYDAFKRYIGDRSPGYVSGQKCSVEEAIEAIHKAKGFAVLAHPHLIDSKSLVRRLLSCKFDGLEAYYARFTQQVNEHWVEKAKARSMFVTGGSDFHGVAKPDSFLG
ncbi:MAG: PHP domain-containing protein, partial [Verrucomicrobia bacterium]|nr:PHP domain-containing protein [Verrucomicrobiota bacterium]